MALRYILEPYKGPASRYTCPRCHHKRTFSRYIDTLNMEHLPAELGRCSREVNCGYHAKPHQFKADNRQPANHHHGAKTLNQQAFAANCVIHPQYVNETFDNYNDNNFVQFLITRFGLGLAAEAVARYRIGTSNHWRGATIFWQIDTGLDVRTGKVMLYDRQTAKRVKTPFNHITWVHALLLKQIRLNNEQLTLTHGDKAIPLPTDMFTLQQCFFGEHLLAENPNKPVGIVESEKSAILASIYLPQITWLAAGSLSMLNAQRCEMLKQHDVTLFPDLNGYARWNAVARQMQFKISTLLESAASTEDRILGLDLADYLLRHQPDDFGVSMIC